MTEMLDPFEVHVVDSEQFELDFELGTSCSVTEPECEACQ